MAYVDAYSRLSARVIELEEEVELLNEELYNYEEYIRDGLEKESYFAKLVEAMEKQLAGLIHVDRNLQSYEYIVQCKVSAEMLRQAYMPDLLARVIEKKMVELGYEPPSSPSLISVSSTSVTPMLSNTTNVKFTYT